MKKLLMVTLVVGLLLTACGAETSSKDATAAETEVSEVTEKSSEELQKEFEGLVYIAASNISAYALYSVPRASVVSMSDYTYEMISDTMCKITVTFNYEGHDEVPGAEATFDTSVDDWYMLDRDNKPGIIGNVNFMINGGSTSWDNFNGLFDGDLPN